MFVALQNLSNDEAWLKLVLELCCDDDPQLVNVLDFISFRLAAEKAARPHASLTWERPYDIPVQRMFGGGWRFNDAVLSLNYSNGLIVVSASGFQSVV